MPVEIRGRVYCVCQNCGWSKRHGMVRGDMIIGGCPEECPKCSARDVRIKIGRAGGLIERVINILKT